MERSSDVNDLGWAVASLGFSDDWVDYLGLDLDTDTDGVSFFDAGSDKARPSENILGGLRTLLSYQYCTYII